MKLSSLIIAFIGFASIAVFGEKVENGGEEVPKEVVRSGHVFGWPFVEWQKMTPRGGTTQGSEVTLSTEPKESWEKLQKEEINLKQRDRLAILSMTGSHRVSFDFLETSGTSESYTPPRPYFSWATEHVSVLEDREDFISLQHALVMFFEDEGEVKGPFVMKHWRQDWQYEAKQRIAYEGELTWRRVQTRGLSGRWLQSVYQVDDSPRYQVMGKWTHEGGQSQWVSDDVWRPLPRREFSVRDDYNVLAGSHTITVGATGWIHVQNNRKLKVENGRPVGVGTELGISRYEAITEPELSPAYDAEWEKVAPYWAEVRTRWDEIIQEQESFSLKAKDGGESLWQVHFGDAGELTAAVPDEDFDSKKAAREAIARFLIVGEN